MDSFIDIIDEKNLNDLISKPQNETNIESNMDGQGSINMKDTNKGEGGHSYSNLKYSS